MGAKQMDLPAMLEALEAAGAKAREETRLAREAVQDARRERRELEDLKRETREFLEDYIGNQVAELVVGVVNESVAKVQGDFKHFADALYDRLNTEARKLVEDVIAIVDGTGDVSPADALRARAVIARFQAQEGGGR